jgi:hypothetical protein
VAQEPALDRMEKDIRAEIMGLGAARPGSCVRPISDNALVGCAMMTQKAESILGCANCVKLERGMVQGLCIIH